MGPYEWAPALCGGESINAFAGKITYDTEPEVYGIHNGYFHIECLNKHSVIFYEE